MFNLLLWVGTILMVLGFLGLLIGFTMIIDPLLIFMFGSTWNMVLMMMLRVGTLS